MTKKKSVLSEEETLRYQNQFSLPGFGEIGQEKLKAACIAVIGAGGLGSPVLYYLVSMGVGKIKIVDFDIVSLSNLHRQVLHTTKDIGKAKVISAKEKLELLNPNVQIEIINEKLEASNAHDIVKDVDVIIDCCDNFETRYLVNQIAINNQKVLCSGSVYQHMGQVVLFSSKDGSPCYQCLYPTEKSSSVIPDNKQVGVWSPMIGVIGCMQVSLVINYLLERREYYKFGELIIYNSQNNSVQKLVCNKNKNCCACGKKKE